MPLSGEWRETCTGEHLCGDGWLCAQPMRWSHKFTLLRNTVSGETNTRVNLVVFTLYYDFIKCSLLGKLGEGYTEPLYMTFDPSDASIVVLK